MESLLLTHRGTVYPWQCDHMGHMNVMWYVGKFDEATWQLMATIGFSAGWLREQQRGMAALEQHITYRRELHAGDQITVYSGIREVKDKTIRFFHEMRRDSDGELAAATTLVGVHLDTVARKACSLPEEMAAKARALILPETNSP